jgi:hypothetical protein
MTSPIVRTACRTGQTAVASIPRRYALSRIREIRSGSCLLCLLSHGNYLLDDGPRPRFDGQGPLLTRPAQAPAFTWEVAHLRDQRHSRVTRGSLVLFSHRRHKAERGQLPMDVKHSQHSERLVLTPRTHLFYTAFM